MHREFHVPDIGEFEDVEVIEVLVGPGDRVDVEQSLVTLESDKATMELPSPWAGTVVQLHMAVGDKVSEGGLVATLDVAEADVAAEPAVPEASAASEKGTQPGDAEPAPVAQSPPPPSAARGPLPAAGPGRPAPARRSHRLEVVRQPVGPTRRQNFERRLGRNHGYANGQRRDPCRSRRRRARPTTQSGC